MLTIELRDTGSPNVPIEVLGTSPDVLKSLSLDQVRRQKVYSGNRPAELGSLFEVHGDPASGQQVWCGETGRVSGIGYRMKSGWIRIEGNCGNWTGARMSDGTIQIGGNAGHWTGSEMSGGLVHVRGNTGHEAGGAMAGSPAGQNGGTLIVEGNAGNAVARMMRRGVIAVGGSVGNCCGYLMVAGTVVVCGDFGKNLATEMTRGTIILSPAKARGDISPEGFDRGVQQALPVAGRLIRKHLLDCGFAVNWTDATTVEIWHGDRLRGSRGELWLTRQQPDRA